MKNYIVAGSIKGFLIICLPKTKKKVSQNSHFLRIIIYSNKNAEVGVLGSYFCLQVI